MFSQLRWYIKNIKVDQIEGKKEVKRLAAPRYLHLLQPIASIILARKEFMNASTFSKEHKLSFAQEACNTPKVEIEIAAKKMVSFKVGKEFDQEVQ